MQIYWSKRGRICTGSWHQTHCELLQVLGFADTAPHVSAFSPTQTGIILLWDFRVPD